MKLSDTLIYDAGLHYMDQPLDVRLFVAELLNTPPLEVMGEDCGGTLTRPIREQWDAGDCEILRLTTYNHPANHPACFATLDVTTVVRPKILL